MVSVWIDHLVKRAHRLVLEKGWAPSLAAGSALDDAQWKSLSNADRRQLATLGLSVKIEERLAAVRAAPVPCAPNAPATRPTAWEMWQRMTPAQRRATTQREHELRNQERAQIDALHRVIRCTRHQTDWRSRAWCVAEIRKLSGAPREAAIRERQESERALQHEVEQAFARGVMPVIRWYADEHAKQVPSSIVLQGADGAMRTLHDFTVADAEKWAALADVRSAGWAARRKWFDDVRQALTLHGVATIGQLPGDIANALADAAETIWKRERLVEEEVS
jgi:hypothetical protein